MKKIYIILFVLASIGILIFFNQPLAFTYDSMYCNTADSCEKGQLLDKYEKVKYWSFTTSDTQAYADYNDWSEDLEIKGFDCTFSTALDDMSYHNGNPGITVLYGLCYCDSGLGNCDVVDNGGSDQSYNSFEQMFIDFFDWLFNLFV